ncbi:MAG: hypothetical protein JWM09_1077, partial [Francisellaceae bacterium]|nr:hypothetical protein [Francisellaceae bacterium]
MKKQKNLNGISGWLILVGIGIIIGPIRLLAQLIVAYSPIISTEFWATITNPETEGFHPLLAPYIPITLQDARMGECNKLNLSVIRVRNIFFFLPIVFKKLNIDS